MNLLSHMLLECLPVFKLAFAVQTDLLVQLLFDQIEKFANEHNVVWIADLQIVHFIQMFEQQRSIAADCFACFGR